MSRHARLLQSECRGSDRVMSIRRHIGTHVRVHSSRALTQTRTITEGSVHLQLHRFAQSRSKDPAMDLHRIANGSLPLPQRSACYPWIRTVTVRQLHGHLMRIICEHAENVGVEECLGFE